MRKGECPDVGIHDVLDGLADQHLVLQRTMSLAMDERRTLPCDVSVCGVSGSVKAGLPIALGPFGCGPAPWLEPITLPSSGVPSRKRSSLFWVREFVMRLHHLMEHAILVRIQGLLIFQPLREDIPHVIGQAILMAPRTSDELRVHGLRQLKAFSSLVTFSSTSIQRRFSGQSIPLSRMRSCWPLCITSMVSPSMTPTTLPVKDQAGD